MAKASNGIILGSDLGSSDPIYSSERDIKAECGYNKARVDGSKSFYIVYSKPEFFDTHEHSSTSSVIVDSSCEAPLGFTARSTQGWDKDGITLLEHHWYCGTGRTYTTSTPDITHEFPSGDRGASSIIVMKGYWSLYTDKNYNGIKISLNGKSEFGPGTRLYSLGPAEDKVKSIKYIREN